MFRSASSSQGWQPRLRIRSASRRRAAICIASAIALACPVGALANTEQDVNNGSTDLTAPATYTPSGAPTTTSDVTFVNSTYSPTTFTISGTTNLSIGSLNDLDAQTQTITIQNGTNNTTSTLTLNGGDGVSGNSSDLLYVASGSTLSLVGTQGTAAVLNVALAASGNFDVVGTATISSVISNAFGITKTGSGLLTLTGANSFSGGLIITAGTVKGSLVNSFGTGTININGGTLATSAAITFTQGTVIGASGGTIDNQNAGKDLFATTSQLTGAGTLTRTGAAVAAGSATNTTIANDVQFSAADTGFSGPVILNGGITEVGANALGTGGATNTITLNTGAEVVAGGTLANNLIINGGILSGDNGNQSVGGTVTANAAFSIRLGDFFQAVNRNLTLSNSLSGSGAFTLIGNQGTTAGAGQTLFLNGNNSGYSANINVPAGYNVSFATVNSFGSGTVTINSTATALGGIGVGYDFGATIPTFTNARTGTTTGGVFGINTTLSSATTLDLSALNGGGMFLGSQSAGTYAAGTLAPDGTTYRLGGGGGTLTFSAAAISGANNVNVGDTRSDGGGTVSFSAAEPYTGTTAIAAGSTLQLAGTLGALTGASSGSITDNGTFAISRTNAVVQGTDFPTNISGSGGISMVGSGTLTLTGGNTYTGPTTILAGTIQSSSDNSLGTGALTFGVARTAGNGALNLGAFNQTVASINVLSNSTTPNTIAIGSGKTLTVTNGIVMGTDNTGTSTASTSKLTISGAGALSVTGGAVYVAVGQATGNAANADLAYLDLSNLTGPFTANVTAFAVGGGTGTAGVAGGGNDNGGVLTLGPGGNTITSPIITVGNSNQNNAGGITDLLTLGTGSNTLNVDKLYIGLSKVFATLAFASQTAGSAGTVTIGKDVGTGATTIDVGDQTGTGTGATITGTLDLRGHTSTVTAGSVTLGNNNNTAAGYANGILNFNTGTFTATSVAIGLKSGVGTGSNLLNALSLGGGTFTVSGTTSMAADSSTAALGGSIVSNLNISAGTYTTGSLVGAAKSGAGTTTSPGVSATSIITVSGTGALVVNSGGTFVLASQATAGSASGTLNITGGTVTSNVNITDGGGVDTTTVTLNGGLLDLTGHNLGGSAAANYIDVLNFQAGTLQNVAEINAGTTPLTKTSTATLIVQGTNTYTGGTAITAGTLRAESTSGSSTGTGAVAVNSGGTLAGSGKIAGANAIVSVNSGGKISAGTGATSSDTPGLLTTTGGPADPTTITAASASEIWNDGGGYAWKVNNTSPNSAPTAGSTDPGGAGKNWDMLAMATLSVQSTNSVGFTITPVLLNGATLSSSGNPYTIADITTGYVAIGNSGPTNYSGNAPALAAALQGLVVLPPSYTNAGYSVGAIPDGGGGDDLVIVYSPAPEPTSLVLMGIGAAGLMLRRRRRARGTNDIR